MRDLVRQSRLLLGPGNLKRWVLVVALALVASVFEAGGALVVFGLLTRITTPKSGFDVPVIGDLRERLPGVGSTGLVIIVGTFVALFFVARAAILVLQSYVEARVTENASADLATRLVAGYLAMPYSFHLQHNSAELIRNTYDTVGQYAREALSPAVRLVSQSLIVLALVTVLLVTSPLATLLAAAVLGPFSWLLLRVIHPYVKRMGRVSQQMSKQNLQTLEESLAGWRDVKILGREQFFVDQYESDRRRLARIRYLRATARDLPRIALETGLVLFILGFLGVSVIVRDGALEALPTLALFGYVAVRLQPSLNEIMVSLNALKFMGPGTELLCRDLMRFPAEGAAATLDGEPLVLRDELQLKGVSVRYPGSPRNALTAVDVTIRAGEFVGVVGPTGGGKSTLVDVILGLLEPTAGSVTVDGVDLRGHEPAWHASLGVVHQTVFLADTTIRRNVALGVPDDEIDDTLVTAAIGSAQLERFVSSLPDGLESIVGQRGVRMSGGQRQRLAIARALYRQPSVLILDEGTSALDHATESNLLEAILTLRGERTIIAVAHRLSTLAASDRILLVDAGRLVDVASFDELAERHAHVLVPRS